MIGDVKTPNRITLDINGMRALDAIARAGGAQNPAYDEVVQLTRHGVGKRVRLSQIISSPAENIYLQPDDTIYVLHDPAVVSILGATNKNTRVLFDTDKYPRASFTSTRAEKLGSAKGKLYGDLTLHGVTKPVVLDVMLNGAKLNTYTNTPTLGFSGRTTIKRSDFNMGMGVPMVSDEVEIIIEGEFDKVAKEPTKS